MIVDVGRGRRALILAVVAVGALTAAGPAPGPPPPRSADFDPEATVAAIAKAFPTPRLYHLKATGTLPNPMDGMDMCLGAGPLAALIAKLSEDPAAVGALGKGCTQTRALLDDGSRRVEAVCDRAAGAFATSRMSLSGTADEMHQHLEVDLDLDLGPGVPKTMVTDTHMTYVGDCPAPMRPGQVRSRTGEISDPMAGLAKPGVEAKAGKATPRP